MKRISGHSGLLEDDESCVDRLLGSWRPGPADRTEKQQEDLLHDYLRQRLPDVPMICQYGIAKGRADIVIEDKHLIELKLGLTEVAEFQRCMGQLEIYRQKWQKKERGPIYLIIVGDSDSEFRDLLHTWFEEANGAYAMISPFHLYEKAPS